jgi:hypothetical protein
VGIRGTGKDFEGVRGKKIIKCGMYSLSKKISQINSNFQVDYELLIDSQIRTISLHEKRV